MQSKHENPVIIWYSETSSKCVRWGSPHIQPSNSHTLAEDSIIFWHYLPRDRIRFHRLRVSSISLTQLPTTISDLPVANPGYHVCFWPIGVSYHSFLERQMLVASPGCYLYFWPTGYKLKVPTASSLGSINFLWLLKELGKSIYLLDCLFVIEEYRSEQLNGRADS